MNNSAHIVSMTFSFVDDKFRCVAMVECKSSKNIYGVILDTADEYRVRDIASCIIAKFNRGECDIYAYARPDDHLYNERIRLYMAAVKRGEKRIEDLRDFLIDRGY